jgi:hypothetical protein
MGIVTSQALALGERVVAVLGRGLLLKIGVA